MPFFSLTTNLSRDKIPKSFIKEIAQVVADCLERPASTMMIQITTDQWMIKGDDDESPCGEATVRSIMNLSEEKNIEHSRKISDKISEIGIPSDRLFINFEEIPGYAVGYCGTTCKAKYGI